MVDKEGSSITVKQEYPLAGNIMRNILWATVGAFIAMAPLIAGTCSAGAGTDCENVILANAVARRGAVVCNQAWGDRKGSHIFTARAEACANTPGMKSLVIRGFRDFDRKVDKVGKEAACEELDELLQGFE